MNITLPFNALIDTVFPSSPLKEISDAGGVSTTATSSAVIVSPLTLLTLFFTVFPQAAKERAVMMIIPERTLEFMLVVFILRSFSAFIDGYTIYLFCLL